MSEKVKTIAVVGAAHTESLRLMEEFPELSTVRFLLFGDPVSIMEKASQTGITVKEDQIVATKDDSEACWLAAHAAQKGNVDVLMKGSVHSAEFIHALLDKELGLLPQGAWLSHVVFLQLSWYHKPFLLTDAAVSILPDIDRKVQIINNALIVARHIGVTVPKVALVAPVETVNPRIVSTTDASQLVFLHKNTSVFGDAIIEGPFGLDVALSKRAAMVKGIEGDVPGDADILVLGNIDAANATYKAFLTMPNVRTAGIVVGARIPVVLTSRSDSKQSRFESIKLALSVSR